MLRVAAHALDAAVLEARRARRRRRSSRAGRSCAPSPPLMIAAAFSTRRSRRRARARAKRSAMRAARRICSATCSSVPSTASGGSPSCSSSRGGRLAPFLEHGRVTSTWNCRPHVVLPDAEGLDAGRAAREHDRTAARAAVVVPLVHVELRRRAREQRIARGRLGELDRHPADLAGRQALGAAAGRLRDQLRAQADAEHRQAARVRIGDDLALAIERRVAVRSVRIDDAPEDDQTVERSRGRLRLRERVPGDGAHAQGASGGSSAASWRIEIVLHDEDCGIHRHALIFAHRRARSRQWWCLRGCAHRCCW